MRLLKAVGGLVAIVVLLSSCIRYEGSIQINDDGSGTVDILSAIDPEALGAFGDLGAFGTDEEICAEFDADTVATDVPTGATITPYNEDGFCGARVTYPLAASDDQSAALADALDTPVRLFKQGDNWFFESDFNVDQVTGDAADFGGDEIVEELFGDASFRITVDLPGRAVDGQTNATNVGPDGQFSWDIDLLNPQARLFAQTEPGTGGGDGSNFFENGGPGGDGDGGGINAVLIGLIVLGLLGAGALFWFLKKRNAADNTGEIVFEPAGVPQQAGAVPGLAPTPGVPAPTASSPTMPVMPSAGDAADAAKETVVINPAQLNANIAAAAAPSTDPVYDEALGAWVVNDPARGRLRHDPATDSWIPI